MLIKDFHLILFSISFTAKCCFTAEPCQGSEP